MLIDMIETEKIGNLDLTIKTKKLNYPMPLNKDFDYYNYFVSVWNGARGSGKTYSLVKFIRLMEKSKYINPTTGGIVPIRTFLISPTVDANKHMFDTLKSLDDNNVYHDYSNQILDDIVDTIKNDMEETKDYLRLKELYDKFVKYAHKKDIVKHFTADEWTELELLDFSEPPEPTFPHGVINNLILDDCLGMDCFKVSRKNKFQNFLIRNRHHWTNVFICSQSIKSLPKTVRTNTSLFILFKYANKEVILKDLYVEVSNLCTEEEFLELFDYATNEPHSFLCLNFTQNDKSRIFRKGFDTVLRLKKI
jgi:hypothetical protein